ncbi:4'-phosphopantetheinyl transferase superfamily protein [Undibacterium sp. TS12]|uniref:4'-phosphopantetheinyl transferase family protein n=1 Tax=Undibacterium sp. TS12 TaxID=2908202 RepID=UPI001F4CB8A2|nr:4'-phosphopantetheinyl transferase superfamily protein [Undibacterium sp. TS12]MCH8620662.1 4'-phosphopantetheinyl transferase superfamily protein [Undibacterium sp. TS12]
MMSIAKVWLVDSSSIKDRELTCYTSWLAPTELRRYRCFVRPERQRQFLIGRVLLRQRLSQLLEVPVDVLQLTERPGNAPQLDFPAFPDIGFSLSHSGNWIGCALSSNNKLGLDIELLNPDRDFSALALHAFDAEESVWINQQDADNRMHAFYQLWTKKEAQIKLNLPCAQCLQLPHHALSITLCSDRQFVSPPLLLQVGLSAEQTPEPVPYPR